MQVGITSFRFNPSGDTVNFTDANGDAFIPDHIFQVNGSCVNNVLYSNGTGAFNTSSFNQNLYQASDSKSVYQGTGENPQFFGKVCSTGAGTGPNAFLNSFESDVFFGGNIYRRCNVTAVGSGFFTYAVSQDTIAFDTDVIVLCIKGVLIENVEVNLANTYSVSFEPKGIWCPRFLPWSTVNNLATAAGGDNVGWGWDSPNGGPNSSQTLIANQGGNYRYITTNSYLGTINPLGPSASDAGAVTAWNSNSITVSAGAAHLYAIGGTNIITATGSFDLNLTTGHQVFEIGIWAFLLFTVTVGTDAENSLLSDYAETCIGFTNGLDAACHWVGESTIGNNLPLKGACFISNNSLIRAVDSVGPNGSSTAFGVTADIVELNSQGTGTIDILTTDSKARKVYWMAIGIASPPIPVTAGGGIYVLVPRKRQDTVWLDVESEDKAFFKIPDPNAYSALIGDE